MGGIFMSRSIEVPIKSFPAGWFVTWEVSSQCYNNGYIQIKSGGNVLDTIRKTDHSTNLQFLGNGKVFLPSQDMVVVISIDEGAEAIYERHQASMILNNKGETVGVTIGICVEDSNDEDYNDFFISLAGWKKQG